MKKDCEVLEKVQRRLMRMLSDVKGETYEDKLEDAGLSTLKERRKRGDLIEAYKTMKGFNKVERSSWFEFRNEEQTGSTRENVVIQEGKEEKKTDVIYKRRANLEVRRNFYTQRVGREWNKLPEGVKNKKTINAFKNCLDKWGRSGECWGDEEEDEEGEENQTHGPQK